MTAWSFLQVTILRGKDGYGFTICSDSPVRVQAVDPGKFCMHTSVYMKLKGVLTHYFKRVISSMLQYFILHFKDFWGLLDTSHFSFNSGRGSSGSGWSAATGHSPSVKRAASGAVEMCGPSSRYKVIYVTNKRKAFKCKLI